MPPPSKRPSAFSRMSTALRRPSRPAEMSADARAAAKATLSSSRPALSAGGTAWLSQPDDAEPYLLVDLLAVGEAAATVTPRGSRVAPWEVPLASLAAANEETQPDNVALYHFSQPALLDNISRRYAAGQPYTYTGEILTSVNPCEPLGALYAAETLVSYVGHKLGHRPPHLYAVAEEAYRLALRGGVSGGGAHQGLVVSGVSGAGKTEANKIIVTYLCWRAASAPGVRRRAALSDEAVDAARRPDDALARRIQSSQVLFEAFGNAATTNNHNSSRFGKFTKLHFDREGRVRGGEVSIYLLEKSRLVIQCEGERSFHALYQLLRSERHEAPRDLLPKDLSSLHYVNQSGRDTIAGVNDGEEWAATLRAMSALGLSDEEAAQVAALLSGVLLLGNLSFTAIDGSEQGATADGSQLAAEAKPTLAAVSELWGLPETAEGAMTRRRVESKRGSVFSVGLRPEQAAMARDSLAKHVYASLFLWITSRVNAELQSSQVVGVAPDAARPAGANSPEDEEYKWIGLLDAFGFELLASNSLEQLLINATNEALQHFFLESALCEAEGVPVVQVAFKDNKPTIDALHSRPRGVLPLTDEECRTVKGSDASLAKKVQAELQSKGHEQGHLPTKGDVRSEKTRATIKDRFSRGVPHFTVNHFAGSVCYDVVGWIEKNNDQLHADLQMLLLQSTHPLLHQVVRLAKEAAEQLPAEAPLTPGARSRVRSGSSDGRPAPKAPTIYSRFSSSLNELMGELRRSRVHFVRCLKPNDKLKPRAANQALLNEQLLFSGMLEAVEMLRAAYPGRLHFVEIHKRFQGKLPREVMKMSPGDFIQALVQTLGLEPGSYHIGISRLFFKTGGAAFLETLQRADADELVPLLKDDMTRWWSKHCLLPASVLGVRGRRRARERRWAVGVVHSWAAVALTRLRFKAMVRRATMLARRRRAVLFARASALQIAKSTAINAAARALLARRRVAATRQLKEQSEVADDRVDVDALQAAIALARVRHVIPAAVASAEALLAKVRGLRAHAEAALDGALTPLRADLDLDSLRHAIHAARAAGVSRQRVENAEASRTNAAEALREAAARPSAAVDTAGLQSLLEYAREVGVEAAAVAAAEARLQEVEQSREKAEVTLKAARSHRRQSLDLHCVKEAVDAARAAGVDAAAVDEMEAHLTQVREQRATIQADIERLAAVTAEAIDLGLLQEAISAGREAGVAADVIEMADQKRQQVFTRRGSARAFLEAAAAPPAASLDIEALRGAVEGARAAGVAIEAPELLRNAESQLKHVTHARMRCQSSRRAAASADLRAALELAAADVVSDALQASIHEGREVGVPSELIEAAEAWLRRIMAGRGDAAERLAACARVAVRSVDEEGLRGAISAARAAGVGAAELAEAERRLDEVSSRRREAAAALAAELSKPPAAVDTEALRRLIDGASAVGIPSEAVAAAEKKLQGIAAARGGAEAQLLATAAVQPADVDLDALSAAIEIAAEAGVAAEIIHSAQVKRQTVVEQRREAEGLLEELQLPPAASLDLRALFGAIEAARTAGVATPLVDAAEALWSQRKAEREAAQASLAQALVARSAAIDLAELDERITTARTAGVSSDATDEAAARSSQVKVERRIAAVRLQTRGRMGIKRRAYTRWLRVDRVALIRLQALARGRAQRRQYLRRRRAAVKIQAAARRERLYGMFREVVDCAHMLKAGNIFIKFSQSGAPHDRAVWLSRDMRQIQWAEPGKKNKGILKSDSIMLLNEVKGVLQGVKTDLLKHEKEKSITARGFQGKSSGIKRFDAECCISILGKTRTLDLQAPSKTLTQNWTAALQVALVFHNLQA
ncbi:hypothetical protein AB1Y20_011337 [Prymnesium parvum]|uniref:Myosin motor domain-containing protein n=1 Tax=Prymnesium parvum TaxID=97485 RepID=A0AB34INK7_PRYPA